MRLDLHLHTTASDGALAPSEVVARAARGRLDLIAITDHDTMAGWDEARRAAKGLPLHLVPALEVSTTLSGRDLHILGYFVDPAAPSIVAHQARAQTRRAERIEEMIENLSAIGVHVPAERVFACGNGGGGTIGRPHLAQAMVDVGIVSSVDEAFRTWIGDDHEAFVPTALLEPSGAIDLIRAAGGLPVWAHPPRAQVDALVDGMVAQGLAGLEVYRPTHSPQYTASLEAHAARLGLVKTGGSDWHSPRYAPLGDFFVESAEVAEFLEAGGL